MRLRKILSLALALCLLMTLLPLHTFAVAETQTAKQAPLYADLKDSARYPKIAIQEMTPEQAVTPEGTGYLWQSTKTYAGTYETADKAALKLREYMVARQTNFDIYVKSTEHTQYDTMVEELLEKATAHTGNPTEGDYLRWQLIQWGGQVDDQTDGRSTFFHFTVEMSYYTTAAQEKEMTTAVNALQQAMNLEGKSDYQKVKAVYDYVCQNVTYDEIHPDDGTYLPMYTAYGALINKTAVGYGYALLVYRLLLELGIDCRVITGQLLTGDEHAWNIVKLGSVYYNLDATMDATVDPDMFFLRNWVMDATHYRYLDYATTEFQRAYPMSENDYVDGVEGVPTRFYIRGVCGDDAYWGIDWDNNLVISGTGATYDYESGNYGQENVAPWFPWQETINSLIVEEGITRLGDYLFPTGLRDQSAEQNLTHITLPESLEEIGCSVFARCDKLTQVRIPDGVKIVGDYAFDSCSSLESVILGKSVEIIESYAFGNCVALTEIQFPDSLKTIEGSAFTYCDSLTEVTIPASVESASGFSYCDNLKTLNVAAKVINHYAFSNCYNLETVVLSEDVQQIGISAFAHCSSLREITIPRNVKTINISAFSICKALETIHFTGDAPEFNLDCFSAVTVTAVYPDGNPTWTKDKLQNYGGTITWVPVCLDHHYEMADTLPTCTEPGGDRYTCPTCGDSYLENEIPALGHTWPEDSCDKPRNCTACGTSSGNDGHIYDDGVDGTCNICGIKREETEARQVVHMFRMYNPNTGEHFYTGSTVERDNLIVAGWHYEGVGFTFPANTGDPVHRLFQPSTGEHLYTMDVAEKDKLMAEGWNYEGIAFNSAYDTEAVQHRLHNPNAKVGAYHFTFSEEEKQTLIDAGWEYQGIGWYSCWK